jgi:hypothetical protein
MTKKLFNNNGVGKCRGFRHRKKQTVGGISRLRGRQCTNENQKNLQPIPQILFSNVLIYRKAAKNAESIRKGHLEPDENVLTKGSGR